MTAVPEPVAWTPPYRGWWLRTFRLGEWLPDAVTPLFADWLLPRIEAGFTLATEQVVGVPLRPDHALINGWYYTTVHGRTPLAMVAFQLLRHPRALRWARTFLVDVSRHPERAEPALERAVVEWRERLTPRYRSIVDDGERAVRQWPASTGPEELVTIVDQVGEAAGAYLWSLASLGGSAWKIEGALARFHQRHLAHQVDVSHQVLLSGLPGTEPEPQPAPHAASSVDWYWPTAGEAGPPGPDPHVVERSHALAARRAAAEHACRAALAGEPDLLNQWIRLLRLAQRYAVVREQQAMLFTLGWPLLRECVLRLGGRLVDRGALADPADVFFLTRQELKAGLHHDHASDLNLGARVRSRRAVWQRQRRLPAPLELGKAPWLARRAITTTIDAARTGARGHRGGADGDAGIAGHPASPGRATGPVRVVVDPVDFPRFQSGEVLVARATAPAWTPLFARAAAVVTDGGSLAAHASLVAREYGIPAVVATGDATRRLHTGQIVTVDGNAGTVDIHD
jgi:pyruvate,water dikinase